MAMLTVSEIRKLIKAHNVLTKITIPKGATRNDLIKLVEKKGYKVDHENKKISRKVDGKPETITLKGAEVIGKPKEKTALQKQKAAEKKEEKAVAQKKKERELKKEAVKKATKDMVPKTKPPKKIGAKPVPQKKPAKKEDEVRPTSKPGRPRVDPSKIKVIQPKKKEEPKKKKEKKKYATEGAKKIGEAIKAKKAAEKKAKEAPKKLKKDLQEDIQGGIELESTEAPMTKQRCKDWIYVSKKLIQADKDNFKKVRLFDKDVSSDVDSFGRSFKTPTQLLKIYDFMSMWTRWSNTADRIRKLCGVQEALFAETAYDILFNKWDKIKDAIVKQNIKKNPDIESKLKKPKQIEYQYYEPKKAAKEKAKEEPLFKEKIETPEETFFRNLKFIINMYNILPGEVGYVDKDKRIKRATIKVLGSIIDKKKTSKFTKPETKKLEEALKFYKRRNSQDKKGIEIFESFVSDTGSEKIRKGTVRERKSLATLKDSWATGPKLTFKWSPEQVKQIEDILNNRDGIESQGYEQKESGFKWVFYFTKNGKQEKLVVKRPDPRPFKEIKELKEKAKN